MTQGQFDVLPLFDGSLDVYSFTTYPSFFGDPDAIPPDYYKSVRSLLPSRRVGFSEVGWPSGANSSEAEQARYYARLPELLRGIRSEFVTLALLHDVDAFTGDLAALNTVGVRHRDGRPKQSWEIVASFGDLR